MTVYSKDNPVGLDAKLLKIQNYIDELDWNDFDVYGQLFINERNGEKIAEAHVGGGEYREVLIDDRRTAVFGFFVGDTRSGINMIKVPVELVCSCNLKAIYSDSEMNDEEVLSEVVKIIRKTTLRPNELQIKTGLDNVFSRISTNRIKHRNMLPWFIFSITFNIVYKV
jgi:hypothetical protein